MSETKNEIDSLRDRNEIPTRLGSIFLSFSNALLILLTVVLAVFLLISLQVIIIKEVLCYPELRTNRTS